MEMVHAWLESCIDFDTIQSQSDGIRLLNSFQIIMMNVQEQCYIYLTVHLTKFNFSHLTQGKQPLDIYYQHFNMILHVLKQMQAMAWDDPGLNQEQINAIATMPMIPSTAESHQAKAEAKE